MFWFASHISLIYLCQNQGRRSFLGFENNHADILFVLEVRYTTQLEQLMQRKFIIGGVLILSAIVYLIVSSSQANAQYFLTVNELRTKASQVTGKEVRISGAVIGESIQFDPATLDLTFEVVNIPGDNAEIDRLGGLAEVLHQAVLDTKLQRLKVTYNGPRPDLLKNEAQAIMTGTLDSSGVFHANELLLKCPTRYDEAVPEQAVK